jgi:ABC-2 type transport system ATP-binding protein
VEVHKEGKTVFFSSHIVPDIEEICDRVIFLKEGKLVYDGAVNTLLMRHKDKDFVVVVQNSVETKLKTPIKDLVSLPENFVKITVSSENKDALLSEAIQLKSHIFSLEMVRPSLEEIFYHTQASK